MRGRLSGGIRQSIRFRSRLHLPLTRGLLWRSCKADSRITMGIFEHLHFANLLGRWDGSAIGGNDLSCYDTDHFLGVLAQLVERNHGMVEVTGSIPVHSSLIYPDKTFSSL